MKTRRTTPIAALARLLLCAAPLLVAAPLAAQEPDPFGPLAVFQLAERQDWLMRATLANGSEVVGRVREVDGAGARLEGGRVQYAELVLLERGERRGGGGVRGAFIGGAILGVLAAAVVSILPGEGDLDGQDYLIAFSMGAGVGVVVGGLIGAALAPSYTHWSPVWPGDSVVR